MGDHFWPAVYPGIAVGLLYGLSLGGTRNIVLASLGALAAAFLSFTLMVPFFTEEGLLPLAALLATSFADAFAVVRAGGKIATARSAGPP